MATKHKKLGLLTKNTTNHLLKLNSLAYQKQLHSMIYRKHVLFGIHKKTFQDFGIWICTQKLKKVPKYKFPKTFRFPSVCLNVFFT